MPVQLRHAEPEDAEAISALLCASIRELCQKDHLGDEGRIADWISNKTPDHVRAFITGPASRVWVVGRGGRIAGMGCFRTDGTILLNYVHPDHRFRGVSKALMDRMEGEIAAAGLAEVRLTSTVTALPFYRARGFVEDGPGGRDWGYPMIKVLASAGA